MAGISDRILRELFGDGQPGRAGKAARETGRPARAAEDTDVNIRFRHKKGSKSCELAYGGRTDLVARGMSTMVSCFCGETGRHDMEAALKWLDEIYENARELMFRDARERKGR